MRRVRAVRHARAATLADTRRARAVLRAKATTRAATRRARCGAWSSGTCGSTKPG